ncbi:MAG TPA: PPC domain-containing protein [Gemmatimonadales bacterium]|nr:PPC domain-containing protein [Gemmatimonadales bacterium]
MTRFTAVRLIASASILTACSDFVAPPIPEPPGIQTIAVGTAVQVILSSGDSSRVFRFSSAVDSTYTVEVVPGSGTVAVTVLDSMHRTTSGFVLASSSTPAGQRWTQTVAGVASDPWLIQVQSAIAGQSGLVTITVHQVATGPEHVATTILPDCFYGAESLDTYGDIDRYQFTGSAGQLIEVFVQGTGPADPTQEVCLTLDTVTGPPLSLAFSRAGDTALEAPVGGAVRLAGPGEYHIQAASTRNGCRLAVGDNDPYLGSYRMVVRSIDTLPETAPESLAVGDTVTGESIGSIGDIDVFHLRGTPGELVNVQLQSPVLGVRREIQVVVSGAASPASTSSVGGDSSLDEHGAGPFAMPASGRVTLRVTGVHDGRGGDAGPYRLYAYPVNPAPEHVPAAITPGDTISGEVIDHLGDVDDFTFAATQGQQFDVFFQASGVPPSATLTLLVLKPDSSPVSQEVFGYGGDTSLLIRSTGRFTVPVTGTYTVRVQALPDQLPPAVGAYRFLVYPVNPAPETAPAVLAFGDSVSSEKIDFPGDVDEFHTLVSDSSGTNIVLVGDSSAVFFPVEVSLIDSVTHSEITTFQADVGGIPFQSGSFVLPPCHCILSVAGGFDYPSLFQGGYTLKMYKFSFGPETVGDTVAIGDTIAGEAINPPGDRDDFVFFGTRGQHVNVALEGQSAASTGQFQLGIGGAIGSAFSIVNSPTSPDSLNAHRTNRIDLPFTGWYHVSVLGIGSPNPLTAPGPYRVALEPVATGPEHGGGILAAGDSVTNEAIDSPGDWDEFILTGTPGDSVSVAFSIAGATGNPVLEVFDSTADSVVATAVGQAGVQGAGPVALPASGQLVIRVYEPRPAFSVCSDALCSGLFAYTGGYKFTTTAVP